ncbi:MAG: 4-(cytidine 5'-diphospho)-2-C-methyl-D-erythritol kinase [Proteobacteria bacterium]|nr:4-(cytidine 5'-diphospho)-2-C-methyl-D-erythritol kinase [Pseudomonadota bacterium]
MTSPGFAPAKVNLFLHVGASDADGYHPISSLVAFADVGDRVSLIPAETAEFVVEGAFAAALRGFDPADNLVLKAVRALEAEIGGRIGPLRIVLDKAMPIAAGLGGGSADAGAALRLLAGLFEPALPRGLLLQAAAAVGADGPMCVESRACIAEGRGERLSPAPGLPELHAVLVNPGLPSPTGAVYRAYDAAGASGDALRPSLPDAFESAEELAAVLAGSTRNDLEAPAVELEPAIGAMLARLRDAPQALFARMSGSGATGFALCAGEIEAQSLAETLCGERPDWWVKPCRLGHGLS